MNCQETKKLLHDFVDGTLRKSERKRLESHVEGCSGCLRELSELRVLDVMLDRMPLEPAPYALADRVMANLREAGRIAEPVAVTRGIFHWTRRRVRVSFAAVALLLVAIAMLPTAIGTLKGMVVKGAVIATDAYVEVEERAADANFLSRALLALERNMRTLKTIALAGLSLLARAGELFMVPALLTVLLLTLGVLLFLRVTHRRSAERATYSF